jgi:hypothetical protein
MNRQLLAPNQDIHQHWLHFTRFIRSADGWVDHNATTTPGNPVRFKADVLEVARPSAWCADLLPQLAQSIHTIGTDANRRCTSTAPASARYQCIQPDQFRIHSRIAASGT